MVFQMDNKTFSQTLAAMTKQMNYIKHNGLPGLCGDLAEIVESNSFLQWNENCQSFELGDVSDYDMKGEELIVRIPYAGTNFTVKLFFNLHEPWIPPDMIFSDTRFMKKILLKDLEDLVPSLSGWNYLSEDIIAQLLMQLHNLYKRYQLNCLEAEEVLNFEYQSLLQSLDIGEEDIEMSLSGGSSWLVSLLIRLPLSLKDVPPALINSNPGESSCLLHVTIKKSNGCFTPRLHLSPQVEALIGGSTTVGLPSVPPESSLADYITNILQLLDDRAKSSVVNFEIRKQFIAELLCHYGSAFLEYDAEKFTKASLLFDWKDFNFILIIDIPDNLNKMPLQLTLQSVYHCNSRGPLKQEISELKFTIQSSPEDMVTTIKSSILKKLPEFQANSVSH